MQIMISMSEDFNSSKVNFEVFVYLGKDITGKLAAFEKAAELDNPPVNSYGYQESPSWGGDLLLYNGEWGSGQMQQEEHGSDGAIEQDDPITYQGERPALDADFYTDYHNAAEQISTAAPWGESESRPKDPSGNENPDFLKTLPQGFGPDADDAQGVGPNPENAMGYPLVTGYPSGFQGVWDSPVGEGTVRSAGETMTDLEKLSAAMKDRLSPKDVDKELAESAFSSLMASAGTVAAKAAAEGVDLSKDRIRIACLDQLFAFRAVSANKLIHKSTNDLWTINAGEDGEIEITREFDDNGNPIQG
jgi:hypothetical protein